MSKLLTLPSIIPTKLNNFLPLTVISARTQYPCRPHHLLPYPSARDWVPFGLHYFIKIKRRLQSTTTLYLAGFLYSLGPEGHLLEYKLIYLPWSLRGFWVLGNRHVSTVTFLCVGLETVTRLCRLGIYWRRVELCDWFVLTEFLLLYVTRLTAR